MNDEIVKFLDDCYSSITTLSDYLYSDLKSINGERINPPLFQSELDNYVRQCFFNKENLLAILPRGTGKSTFINVFTLTWYLLFTNKRNIVMVGATQSSIQDHLQTFRENFINNKIIKAIGVKIIGKDNVNEVELLVPCYKEEYSDKNNKGFRKVLISCFGSTNIPRGINYNGHRPDMFIIDDLERESKGTQPGVESKTYREEIKQIFQKNIISSGFNIEQLTIIMLGTVLHEDQLLLSLYNNNNDKDSSPYFNTIKYPLIENYGEETAYSNWPEKYSVEAVYKIAKSAEKNGTLSSFYNEYQNELIINEKQIISTDSFSYYKVDNKIIYNFISENNFKKNCNINSLYRFFCIDPAYTTNSNSDYSVIFSCGIDNDNNLYILDCKFGQYKPEEFYNVLKNFTEKYKPEKIYMEKNQAFSYLNSILKQELIKVDYKKDILPLNHCGVKKHKRIINNISNRFAKKTIFFPIGKYKWLDDLKEQIKSLTDDGITSKHDDIIDCLSYCCYVSITEDINIDKEETLYDNLFLDRYQTENFKNPYAF